MSNLSNRLWLAPVDRPVYDCRRIVMASYGDWDRRERVRHLDLSTVVVHGEQESIPMDLVEEWVTSLPNARLVRVPRTAHVTYAARPEIVWPEVDRFSPGGRDGLTRDDRQHLMAGFQSAKRPAAFFRQAQTWIDQ